MFACIYNEKVVLLYLRLGRRRALVVTLAFRRRHQRLELRQLVAELCFSWLLRQCHQPPPLARATQAHRCACTSAMMCLHICGPALRLRNACAGTSVGPPDRRCTRTCNAACVSPVSARSSCRCMQVLFCFKEGACRLRGADRNTYRCHRGPLRRHQRLELRQLVRELFLS